MSDDYAVLPCGHIWHNDDHSGSTLPSSCPTCLEDFSEFASVDLKRVIASLCASQCPLLQRVIEDKRVGSQVIVCRDCEKNPCQVWCETCEGGFPYCEECSNAAHVTRRQLEHVRYCLHKSTDGNVVMPVGMDASWLLRGARCKLHENEMYTMFCMTCSQSLCPRCVTEHHYTTNDGHRLTVMSECGEFVAEQLNTCVQSLQNFDDACHDAATKTTRLLCTLQKNVDHDLKQIEFVRLELLNAVEERVQLLRNGLQSHSHRISEEFYFKPMRIIAGYRESVAHFMHRLRSAQQLHSIPCQASAMMDAMKFRDELVRLVIPYVPTLPRFSVVSDRDKELSELTPAEAYKESNIPNDDVDVALNAIANVGVLYGDAEQDGVTNAANISLLVPRTTSPTSSGVRFSSNTLSPTTTDRLTSWADRYEKTLIGLCRELSAEAATTSPLREAQIDPMSSSPDVRALD